MSILSYNGSALVAMTGKNCVGIASDTRYGVQAQTISCDMKRVFKLHDKLMVGLSGLATDVTTCHEKLEYRCSMYKLREERDIKPSVFNNMMASFLYQKRFGPYFVEPLVAGLEGPENKPFISGLDLIGAPVFTDDFVVCGTTEDSLYGTCECMYRPNLEPDELFEVMAQCLLSAVDRDCLAGWGGEVHILTPTEYIVKTLKGRHD